MTSYESMMARCKNLAGFPPDAKFKSIGDIWQKLYVVSRGKCKPEAELIVGYLSEFIDRMYTAESEQVKK